MTVDDQAIRCKRTSSFVAPIHGRRQTTGEFAPCGVPLRSVVSLPRGKCFRHVMPSSLCLISTNKMQRTAAYAPRTRGVEIAFTCVPRGVDNEVVVIQTHHAVRASVAQHGDVIRGHPCVQSRSYFSLRLPCRAVADFTDARSGAWRRGRTLVVPARIGRSVAAHDAWAFPVRSPLMAAGATSPVQRSLQCRERHGCVGGCVTWFRDSTPAHSTWFAVVLFIQHVGTTRGKPGWSLHLRVFRSHGNAIRRCRVRGGMQWAGQMRKGWC